MVQPLREEGESILGEDLYMRMLFDYLLYVNVLAPTYHYAIFIYIPGIFAAVSLALIQAGTFNKDAMVAEFSQGQKVYLPIGLLVFYILQRRELKRFFEQQVAIKKEKKAFKKEQQITTVLNSQSDAIVVVNQRKQVPGANVLESNTV